MKGSSSVGLPEINNVRSLVANPYANPNPKKKNKDNGKRAKEKKLTKMAIPKRCFENDILSQHEESSTSKNSKMESNRVSSGYLRHEKNEYLEQRKMAEMEAFFRGKRSRGNGVQYNPYREQGATSLQKRRLASAKSRDYLLSLIPNNEPSRTYMNEDLVVSAKQELEMIRRHTNRLLGRDDSGQRGSLYNQSLRASKMREMMFGVRDKTNNSVEIPDHVMDSRRPHFLAPISTSHTKNGCDEIETYYSESFRDNERTNKEGKYDRPIKDGKECENVFDFCV